MLSGKAEYMKRHELPSLNRAHTETTTKTFNTKRFISRGIQHCGDDALAV